MMTKLTYFLYAELPGYWTKWTLAVLAVNRTDANQYVKALHHGGKYVGKVEQGTFTADCGAVTGLAALILHEKMEKEYEIG